ncbi:FtsK/SpoIIIE domain-containing protein [Cellulomonas hominis]
MRTRLVLRRPGGATVPIVVTTDAAATAGDVADALLRADRSLDGLPGGSTLRVAAPGADTLRTVPRTLGLLEAGVRAGSTVAVGPDSPRFAEPGTGADRAVARLTVLSGPDAGLTVDLPAGTTTVGRGPASHVRLRDLMVSKTHARIVVTDTVEVVDHGSANGVLIGDGRVSRATLGPSDVIVVGETELQVRRLASVAPTETAGAVVAFNRSPRVVARYPERTVTAPQPPDPEKPGRFPVLAMVAPLAMGTLMFAMTRNPLTLAFVGLSPLLMVGTWWDRRSTERRRVRDQTPQFRTGLAHLVEQVGRDHAEEVTTRLAEEPSTADAVDAAHRLGPVLWSRRPEQDSFLAVRLGTGRDVSRTTVKEPARGNAVPELWDTVREAVDGLADVEGVPIVAQLRDCGALGVAGTGERTAALARGLVLQLAALHSPAELVLAGVASTASAPRWSWLTWLPHVASAHSPLTAHLGASPAACSAVLTGLEELVAARRTRDGRDAPLPVVVLVVEDDTPAERGRLVRLAEEGPAGGVHVLWCAPGTEQLPAACRTFLVSDGDGTRVGRTGDGTWRDLAGEPVDGAVASAVAQHLAGVVDAGAPVVDESDLPRAVGFLALAGDDLAWDPQAVVDRWHETGSVLDRSGGPPVRRRSDASLRALVGQGTDQEFVLDLRTQGPHALVGGTTGAGKSEFLQAWVLGLATAHSPDRVTFLFVDYKGGAAFADCVDLPHCVGLVTDLSPHLVRRALTSLRAELRHRERLLARAAAKDLLTLERTGDPRTPPALVIVVDEFAALVQEVPEFVDGMVDVAQRGRSLGLHLVLATQRPAGAIKDNLRANTNLRVALRMADEHDSTDVLGSPVAAELDPTVPGRGAVRTGPGRIAMFQTGYVGGRSDAAPDPVAVGVETLTFGPGEPWDVPQPVPPDAGPHDDGPTDAARVVATTVRAARLAGVPSPRRPWLPELPATCVLPLDDGHGDGALPLGLVDLPARQRQDPFVYRPDDDGSMVVFGTSGSGRSTLLRTVALAAASARGSVELHALDLGSGGLAMLEALPQLSSVVDGSDDERVHRVLRLLVDLLDTRAAQFAAVNAGTLADYRRLTGRADVPRVFLLLDGLGTFRDTYEFETSGAGVYQRLLRVVAEGRPLGVHVVMSAERPNAPSTALLASVQLRVVLRMAEENAYAQVNAPRDVIGPTSPAGRCVLAGSEDEIQVATVGGASEPSVQAGLVAELADRMRAAGVRATAPVRRLPAWVDLDDLPDQVGGDPVLGLASDTLAPLGFARHGGLLVAGPPGSGRSSTLVTLARSLRRHDATAPLFYLGNRRSPAARADLWDDAVIDPQDTAVLIARIGDRLTEPVIGDHGATLVVDGLALFPGTPAEFALLDLMRAARRNGHLLIVESEMATWMSGASLFSEAKAARRGLALQPDPDDGELLFRVRFPTARRADYPTGRGMWVDQGRASGVQVATGGVPG